MPTALFTSETAKQYAKLSVAVRQAKAKGVPGLVESGSERYKQRRLARVREQLDRVDAMLMLEKDPAKLDRLAAASMRLSDQEFALANRPKPGLLKPTTQAQRRPARPEPTPSKASPSTSPVAEPEKPVGASGVGEGGSV